MTIQQANRPGDSSQLEGRTFSSLVSSASWGGRTTRAEIDLDSIALNVRQIKLHAAGARLLVVVKANGYGHGAVQVARTVLESGAEHLGVYTVDEGISLRNAGITAPILVFGPFSRAEAGQIVAHNLTPNLTTLQVAEWLAESAGDRRVPYHLKIDTGLTRAGVPTAEAVAFVRRLGEFRALQPEGIFTHFASADEEDKHSTQQQFETFLNTVAFLAREGFTFPIRHAANSAATLDLPNTHLEMVRCGIGVYGYYPSAQVRHSVPLHPAMQLVSTVVRVYQAPVGTGVGYGHTFRCSRETMIALVPIGYGDGLPRHLGCGAGSVIVRGRGAPIVGRVSMDQITIDVSEIPGVAVGDRVIVIGQDGDAVQTADDLAEQARTISYDILTGLLPRVPRLYVRAAMLIGHTTLTD